MADKEEIDYAADYYSILGVDKDAPEKKISTAYKKLALKYHPDKNPNNEAAAAMFMKIKQAQAFLLDKDKRAKYDKKRNEKLDKIQKHEDRLKSMDQKRRKMREELEKREARAKGVVQKEDMTAEQKARYEAAAAKRKFEAEKERLREENLRRRQAARWGGDAGGCRAGVDLGGGAAAAAPPAASPPPPPAGRADRKVKVKWRTKTASHSEDTLVALFRPHGTVIAVEMGGGPKRNAAVVEFSTASQAQAAIKAFEGTRDMKVAPAVRPKSSEGTAAAKHWTPEEGRRRSQAAAAAAAASGGGGSGRERETLAERAVRQSAERADLARALAAEEGEGGGGGSGGAAAAAGGGGGGTPPAWVRGVAAGEGTPRQGGGGGGGGGGAAEASPLPPPPPRPAFASALGQGAGAPAFGGFCAPPPRAYGFQTMMNSNEASPMPENNSFESHSSFESSILEKLRKAAADKKAAAAAATAYAVQPNEKLVGTTMGSSCHQNGGGDCQSQEGETLSREGGGQPLQKECHVSVESHSSFESSVLEKLRKKTAEKKAAAATLNAVLPNEKIVGTMGSSCYQNGGRDCHSQEGETLSREGGGQPFQQECHVSSDDLPVGTKGSGSSTTMSTNNIRSDNAAAFSGNNSTVSSSSIHHHQKDNNNHK